VLGQEVKKHEFPGMTIGVLPHGDGDAGGCLLTDPDQKPSSQGVMIYLNVDGRLDEAIGAVSAHGGKIIEAKHEIAPFGFRAIVHDSEGNRIALHSE
jgi:predicted enzyme related to lactoylglutathione lyase